MFTGLVESIGKICMRSIKGSEGVLDITPEKKFGNLKIGESIAVNGTCLTLRKLPGGDGVLSFNVLAESFKRTNLGVLNIGAKVNLERALAVGDRLGGHIVQGHVDIAGSLSSWERLGRDWVLTVKFPNSLRSQFVLKGSVTLDGVSLTIVNLKDNMLSVHIIPTTYSDTALCERKVGDLINIETDVIGKYVCQQLTGLTNNGSDLDINSLFKAGW